MQTDGKYRILAIRGNVCLRASLPQERQTTQQFEDGNIK